MHRYGQYCPVARAAKVLADRWTVLIVRELLADIFNEVLTVSPSRLSLHHALHNEFTDLLPHIRPDAGRKPEMESCPDAGVRNLVGKDTEVGPAVRDAGRGRTGHRNLGNVRGTKHSI